MTGSTRPIPNPSHALTLADANEDSTAYLVNVEDEADLAEWLELNGVALFEEELNSW